MRRVSTLVSLMTALALTACDPPGQEAAKDQTSSAINAEDLAHHTRILSSDEFEGRGPASAGEEKTVAYLTEQFQRLGLSPAFGDSYAQEVPLVEITANPENAELTIRGGSQELALDYYEDMVIWTKRDARQIAVEQSEMVFVGYGIVAPEYGWNDYEGVDVTGKTVVILINDPGFATGDPALFNGKAMTYYGRWTYKYEEAARQGAAAAIIIHETEPAAYPWAVVQSSWTGPQMDLLRDGGQRRLAVEGWINHESARRVFDAAGLDLSRLEQAAVTAEFSAVPMATTASARLSNDIRESVSSNVVGILNGGMRDGESVLYMAHWDHLGRGAPVDGDDIYNGALDNATGVAGLIEIAERFAKLDQRPHRSIVFAAVTAEEQGLLGSEHYANNPALPLAKTAAAINMDGLNIIGPVSDITVIGWNQNELQDYLVEAAAQQDREVAAEPTPEHGYFYRSDHFNLAKKGVPVLYTDTGVESIEHGREWAIEQRETYIAENYHKPSDEFSEDWNLDGAVDDLRLFFRIGRRIATGNDWPNWYPDSEFKSAHVDSLAERPGDDGVGIYRASERAHALAQGNIVVDTHIDVPYRLEEGYVDVGQATDTGDFDYPRANEGGLNVIFMSIYTPADLQDTENANYDKANELIDLVNRIVAENPDKFAIAASVADVRAQAADGVMSFALGMENGAPINDDLDNLDEFYERGIRYITLAHSEWNQISDSSYDPDKHWGGLSDFGRDVVLRMNELGIMVDISHVSDQAFWDVMELTDVPAIASHSSARHFTPGFERNMSDEMIARLAEEGGVIMINYGSAFLTEEANAYNSAKNDAYEAYLEERGIEGTDEIEEQFDKRYREQNPYPYATLNDVLDHIDHVVELAGIDHVGIGSDYDGVGDSLPIGLKDVSSYPNLVEGLLRRGYSENDVSKILGKNLLRVWSEVEAHAAAAAE